MRTVLERNGEEAVKFVSSGASCGWYRNHLAREYPRNEVGSGIGGIIYNIDPVSDILLNPQHSLFSSLTRYVAYQRVWLNSKIQSTLEHWLLQCSEGHCHLLLAPVVLLECSLKPHRAWLVHKIPRKLFDVSFIWFLLNSTDISSNEIFLWNIKCEKVKRPMSLFLVSGWNFV